MKRLFMFAVILGLLVLMVSSVSADEVDSKATPIIFGSGGVENVIIDAAKNLEVASNGDALPTDEVSLNGGGKTVTVIIGA